MFPVSFAVQFQYKISIRNPPHPMRYPQPASKQTINILIHEFITNSIRYTNAGINGGGSELRIASKRNRADLNFECPVCTVETKFNAGL